MLGTTGDVNVQGEIVQILDQQGSDTFVEVLRDVAFRLVPLEPRDAAQMIREIRGLPVLEGTRGQPGVDFEALESLLLSVSAFVESHPEVAELDLNPVFAYPAGHQDGGAVAVDARVVLSEAVPA